jgi:hypothetical protein
MYFYIFMVGAIVGLLTWLVLILLNKDVDAVSYLIIWAGATIASVLANVILVISTP